MYLIFKDDYLLQFINFYRDKFTISVLKESLYQNRVLCDSLGNKQNEFWDFTTFNDRVGTQLL